MPARSAWRLGFARTGPAAAVLLTVAAILVLVTSPAAARPMSRAEARERADALSSLGKVLFSDPRLSGSGRLACASCHDPDHAFAPANGLSVQLGGTDMGRAGGRAVPSLKYLQAVPQFTEHFFESEDEADESVDNGPTGGLTWDGRADSAHEQARIPLLSVFEMGNRDPGAVVRHALDAGYGPKLAAIYGPAILDDRKAMFKALLKALEVYEQSWQVFYPYSSKYDAFLAGKAALTPQEARGLKLFEDPAKGNCSSCHFSARADDGTPPQFTDYGMIALAVPRNPAIPANADPAYHDLGLCGPLRTDFLGRADYCGLFRTPSLRNVATRKVFFHNGVFHSLKQAVSFYATRDTDPGRWYPKRPDGSVAIYDDLPARYRETIDMDAPFGGKPGDKPRLSDDEIDALVAFLGTLTDGWKASGERSSE
ncbi:MAG: cytochrome-c peroxidase [Pararhizobium sp.]